MAQVTVNIMGRQFRMACEDGQESHVTKLATDLDRRIEGLRAQFGQVGELRMIIMAALMVADELDESGTKLKRLDAELSALKDARVVSTDRDRVAQDAVAAALNSAAERIEAAAKRLNQSPGPGVPLG